jgi:hypothetical protein
MCCIIRMHEAAGLLQLVNFCLMSKKSVEILLEEPDTWGWLPQLITMLQDRSNLHLGFFGGGSDFIL